MRYRYSIHFSGTVNDVHDTETLGKPESIDDIHTVVIESFRPDLQAGVTVEGLSIHVDIIPENDKTGKE